MPSKLKKAIGAVKDQASISLAKVASNNKTNLEVAVLKATSHDNVPMDERHVYEILRLVSSNKAYAAACARAIGKRVGRTRNWIVAIKSLLLVLLIFQDGDPYFPREVLHAMKRGAKILNLSSFKDDSNSSPWDYTAFVRTFALYLDERLDCFLTGKLQRRYTHQEREPFHRRGWRGNEPVRDMKPSMLLDKISYWQRLLDRAVATRPTGSAKENRLIQISLYVVVQESFYLYRDISDGLALLLDSFFHLQYNSCVNAFQACLKATKQFEELSNFYDLCKSIGVGRTSEYPSVQTISEELIETLQEFLKDQTSFPGRSPNRPPLLLLPAPPSDGSDSSRRPESCRPIEFESQCTSLEDLISATELTEATPSISIDLETYSIADEFNKNSPKGSPNDDTGSTRSLPITSSIVDLVSLEEWPQNDEKQKELKEEEENPEQLDPFFANGWEIVLSETATTSTQQFSNGFDPFSNQEQGEQTELESDSRRGWELILAQPTDSPPLYNLHQQNSVPPQQQYYNPFLQDSTETVATGTELNFPIDDGFSAAVSGRELGFPIGDGFSTAAPTFQATTTFCAQNSGSTSVDFQNKSDPFATFPIGGLGDETFSSSGNQQNLLQEQQLWLQQQNKIIARHMA